MKSSTAYRRLPLTFICLFMLVLSAHPGYSGPITIFSASGNDPLAIQNTVNAFRLVLGANNGNALGSQTSGHREINWDGGGIAAPATTFSSPMNTFNSGATPRGLVSTTGGTGFEISGQPSTRFDDINPTYSSNFQEFSFPRLFTPLGSNVMDANFFVPGTSTPASVFAFGAVFVDVDLPNTSSLEFFSVNNLSLGTFFVPTANNGLSFLGVTFSDPIGRVRITTGNTAIGPNDAPGTDIVVLDDFIYSEPGVVPEPATLLLLGTGLVAATRARRKRGE